MFNLSLAHMTIHLTLLIRPIVSTSEIGRHFDPELGKLAYDELDALYEIYEANCAEGK
jgi:hypothetical protein